MNLLFCTPSSSYYSESTVPDFSSLDFKNNINTANSLYSKKGDFNSSEITLRRIARQDSDNEPNEGNSKFDNTDYVFEKPDLVKEHSYNDETIHLVAYKIKSNDAILNNKNKEKYSQLHWVSLGHPELAVKNSNLFHFTNSEFYTHVIMLTKAQKSLFVNEVKRQYNIDVGEEQITTLIPSEFKCKLKLFCDEEEKSFIGKVNDMNRWPLTLRFEYRRDLKECIKEYISENLNELELRCEILSTSASSVKENFFSIDFKSESNNELVNRLFGEKESVYVTRNQMDDFSQTFYSSMNVLEQYEIPEHQFSESFVDDLIKQLADDGFKPVPFEQAINGISRFNIDADLQPDEITSEYSKVFDVKQEGGKDHLIINKEQYEKLNERNRAEHGGSVSGGFAGFSAGVSYNQAKEKQKEMEKSGKSVNDQLNEFNRQSDNTVEFRLDGKKVIPKSLKVAKFTKSKFKKSVEFKRIKRIVKKVLFNKQYSLTVNKHENVSSYMSLQESIQALSKQIESRAELLILNILYFVNSFKLF